jgi:quinol monooxygenase YgiN
VIVSILRFKLKPNSIQELHQVFQRHRIFETAMAVEGCWKLVLANSSEPKDEASVIGFWQDREAYQRWLDHPERGRSTNDLMPLMAGDFDASAAAQLYEVLQSNPEPPAWE